MCGRAGLLDCRSGFSPYAPHRTPPRSSEVLPKFWKNSGKIIAKRMQSQIKHLYVFGSFRFDPEERLLLRDGRPVPLSPKLTEALFLLVQNAGHLVGKDELMKRLWPDAFVEEGNLNKNIFVLRKTLGQWDGGLEYIETVSKRGYRFVAPVDRVAKTETPQIQTASALNAKEGTSARTTARIWTTLGIGAPLLLALIVVAAWQMNWRKREPAATSFTPAIHSIAVLPLEDLSGDPSENYFADGMTDELITRLGQLTSLRVISRTSAMQYRGAHKPLPQIAHELNVDAIVEGTVVRSGGKVRITAQLIQAHADKHLWAQSYDGDLKDVLSLQNAVANAIAKQIRMNLTPRQQIRAGVDRPANPEAYELYLKGEYSLNRETPDSLRTAIGYFQQTIEKDPNYAPAYVKLSSCIQILAIKRGTSKRIAYPRAKLLIDKALELDPQFSAAHAVRGWSLLLYDFDFAGAGIEFKRAVELDPNGVEGHQGLSDYYASMGQMRESVEEAQRARELDPLALIANVVLCRMLYFARRYDDALAQCKANLDLDANQVRGLSQVAAVYAAKGMDAEATSTFLRSLEAASPPKIMISAANSGASKSGLRGYWEALVPFIPENLDNGNIDSWDAAVAYTSAGNNDKALFWLTKSADARCFGITFLGVDPTFDRLRSDPRFVSLLRRVGLPGNQPKT
jgi:TolB-like protein/DNA-binding winged helix-turn-helix (wHTH) protein